MAADYDIPDVTYDGVDPDPVEWANQWIKPAIVELASRTVPVLFTATMNGGAPSIGSNVFTTWPLDVASVNIGGGSFNTSTYIYTVPMDGLYLCLGGVRLSDGATARSFATGIDTSNGDSPHVLWGHLGGFNRNGRQYSRLAPFYEGDPVRLFVYSEGVSDAPISSGWGNFMTLLRLGDL